MGLGIQGSMEVGRGAQKVGVPKDEVRGIQGPRGLWRMCVRIGGWGLWGDRGFGA